MQGQVAELPVHSAGDIIVADQSSRGQSLTEKQPAHLETSPAWREGLGDDEMRRPSGTLCGERFGDAGQRPQTQTKVHETA